MDLNLRIRKGLRYHHREVGVVTVTGNTQRKNPENGRLINLVIYQDANGQFYECRASKFRTDVVAIEGPTTGSHEQISAEPFPKDNSIPASPPAPAKTESKGLGKLLDDFFSSW